MRALLEKPFTIYLHTDERFAASGFSPLPADEMKKNGGGWEFSVAGTGFQGTFRLELDKVPEEGQPIPFEAI